MRSILPVLTTLLVVGCHKPADDDAPTPTDASDVPQAPQVTEGAPEGEARAGQIASDALLIPGVFSEAQQGDWILTNGKVRFLIQGDRDGSFLIAPGGGVLDADIVRPEGEPGRDMIKDWAVSLGLGRLLRPTSFEVVNDGLDGEAAILRVEGTEEALTFIEGNLEAPGLIAPLGLRAVQTYTLHPDSWFLEVTTEVFADDEAVDNLSIGDLLMGAPEVSWAWSDSRGLDGLPSRFRWTSFVADDNRQAVALFAAPDQTLQSGGFDLVAAAADLVGGASDPATVSPEASLTHTRWYGVAPDLGTLTDAWLTAAGEPTEALTGTVKAGEAGLEGLPVAVTVDGAPFTLTTSGPGGAVDVLVPAGAEASLTAVARDSSRFVDLPEGWVPTGPYAAQASADVSLASLTREPASRPRGHAPTADPLVVTPSGSLTVDAGPEPFTVELLPSTPEASASAALVPGRPSGRSAVGWSRGGPLTLWAPEGEHTVLVHRGARATPATDTVTLSADTPATLDVSLTPADCATDGWVLTDPHSHAVSSADAAITMEERLIVQAASGLDVHFGTDHDRLSDYDPLVAALDLEGTLHSVLALEFSPTTRGHINVYPMIAGEGPNLGSWDWWNGLPDTTDEALAILQERYDSPVLQSNHPTDGGIAGSAGWKEGRIAKPDRWSERLEAVEVLNSGDSDDYFDFWLDLTLRGYLTTPVGVSDSHGHQRGHQGFSSTWVALPDNTELSDASVSEAIRAGRAVPTRGVFLELSALPDEVLSPSDSLTVSACTPSFATVDRLKLLKDGEVVETVEGAEATFSLSTEDDAVFLVIAEGDSTMMPVDSGRPWALAGPYLVDVGADGFTAPLPPLGMP